MCRVRVPSVECVKDFIRANHAFFVCVKECCESVADCSHVPYAQERVFVEDAVTEERDSLSQRYNATFIRVQFEL